MLRSTRAGRVDERRPRGAAGERLDRRARPVPQKRSRTVSPSTSPRIEKSASRTRSLVGRTSSAAAAPRAGARRARRRSRPSRRDGLRALVAEAQPRPRPSAGPSAGASSEPCSLEQRDHLPARREQQVGVLGQARRPGSAAARSAGFRAPRPPAQLRSTSASLKPSRSRAIASRRSARPLGLRIGEEDAVGLVLAAADAPAQLVELGEPVAVGALDQHHARVGDVDPDLDHARRHQHLRLAGREPLHRRGLVARGHLPVEDLDLEPREARPRAAARPRRSPPSPRSFSDSATSGQTT